MKEQVVHGIQPHYMDLNADPGKDFNRYCNGKWIDGAVIPSDKARWGAFEILREQNRIQLQTIFADLLTGEHEVGTNAQKIADFYASGMDEAAVEAAGAKPLAPEFQRIASIRTMRGLADVIARLHNYGVNAMFGFGGSASFNDSSMVIGHALQGGLGMDDRTYYLNTDAKSQDIRDAYVATIQRMFELLGEKPKLARKRAKVVMAIETKLAEASMTKEDRRDPNNINNPMSMEEFEALIPRFPMHRYFKTLGAPAMESLNVMQPSFFVGLNELLETFSLRDWKSYLRWQLIKDAASTLSSDFVTTAFDFYSKKLQGTEVQEERWKRIQGMTNGALGEAIGQLYVEKYFPAEAKTKMLELIELCREALREIIQTMNWKESTRDAALAKLDNFQPMIGYPDKWRDYSALHVDRSSFAMNCLRAAQVGSARNLAKIGKPVDRSEWSMTPQTINAYASQQKVQIVFPAAILQPPFFDFLAPVAVNFGGICVVICHEITHLFDDKGAKYDKNGNLNVTWTDEDFASFNAAIDLIIAQFDSFTVEGGMHVNGKLVTGEAAADLGGLKIAYRALQKWIEKHGRTTDANGFTDEQQFYIAFAQLWAAKVTPQYAEYQVTNDPHPPAQFRVNGTVAHVKEFPQAFGLRDDCDIMLPLDKRCPLW